MKLLSDTEAEVKKSVASNVMNWYCGGLVKQILWFEFLKISFF